MQWRTTVQVQGSLGKVLYGKTTHAVLTPRNNIWLSDASTATFRRALIVPLAHAIVSNSSTRAIKALKQFRSRIHTDRLVPADPAKIGATSSTINQMMVTWLVRQALPAFAEIAKKSTRTHPVQIDLSVSRRVVHWDVVAMAGNRREGEEVGDEDIQFLRTSKYIDILIDIDT
ncbi:hypothetical protein L198_06231 [Cryptococcus wingfieldii CBS 7118]|uniref:Uncharacterized protein n=1 Tax=Cryptococcus wingfieldii CBS 7118 TaxID=1295528 RepID=A0A1E3INN3_9TREE|nr:hypothetical protein L198_06231 [Cryptococcus wingfieldii CBS 7118]ODN90213.1 hypothetical protein L198_06231 [Cryptococcus wingfieldii CBS 7118]